MTASVFSKVNNAGSMWGKQQELQKDLAITQQAAQAIASNPEAADSVISALNKLRNMNTGAAKTEGLVREETPAVPTQEVNTDPLGLGRQTYEQKFNTLVDSARRKGATANAALEYADKMTKADSLDIKNTEDKLKNLRESTAALDGIISTAELGVKGAGETGGFGGGARNLASKAASLFSTEQQAKQTAQSMLDSVGPDIIKASRSQGAGAMSDREMEQYLKAGPSSANTPEANLALLDKYKAVSSMNKEYVNFLEKVQADYGSTKGADKLWQQYKTENPLFVQGQDGEYAPNLDRPNIFDWVNGATTKQSPLEQSQSVAAPVDAASQAREILRKRGIAGY
jgi:hypothetical protein